MSYPKRSQNKPKTLPFYMIECSIMLWGKGEMEVGETMNVLPLGVVW
jgi:hypothetical protein